MSMYDGMGFFEKIAFTIALPVLAPLAVVTVAYEKITGNEETSDDDYERKRRQENERAEQDARNLVREQEEARKREQTALVVKNAKILAVSFLNEHYRNHKKLSVFLISINQQGTHSLVKSKFSEIVEGNFCDEVVTMTNNMEKKTIEIAQLDTALVEIKKLKSSF